MVKMDGPKWTTVGRMAGNATGGEGLRRVFWVEGGKAVDATVGAGRSTSNAGLSKCDSVSCRLGTAGNWWECDCTAAMKRGEREWRKLQGAERTQDPMG